VAHAIHALSHRSGKPFVTVDCGCLAPTLIESELYGVERGAYTGASTDRSGLVQAAQEGTLFLDEIGELPLGMQPKLLRLLEEGEIRRLGSHRATNVNVRVISATSRDLEHLITGDGFRLDLFYRLNVLRIELPPLRQRLQDVPLLAAHFASRHTVHGEPVSLAESALEALGEYSWPGNVRELKNCIEATIAASTGSLLQRHHIPARFLSPTSLHPAENDRDTVNLKRLERRAIERALRLAKHDKTRAARLLGIGKTTLYRKLKEIAGEPEPAPPPSGPYLM
jgi:two-component system response regulator HydG